MKFTASFKVMEPSRATRFFRCVMMSPASLSSSSKILVIISASLASKTPCSWPSLTMDMMSSSVTFSLSDIISIPISFKNRNATALMSQVNGIRGTMKKVTTGSML